MFNVNPSRMFRNKDRYTDKSTTRKIPFFRKPKRKPTHKASKRRRAKSLRKHRMFFNPKGS